MTTHHGYAAESRHTVLRVMYLIKQGAPALVLYVTCGTSLGINEAQPLFPLTWIEQNLHSLRREDKTPPPPSPQVT